MLKKITSNHSNINLGRYIPKKKLSHLLDLNQHTPQYDWDSLLGWIEKYLTYSVKTSSPDFNNRMWSAANFPSILGEIVSAFQNTSSCTYESSPVASLMEEYMIKEMLHLVGFENGTGQMTSGSSQANMIAMMIARNKISSNIKQKGLFQQKPLFAFVSCDAHYSFDKAANVLGIGTEYLIKIPTNNQKQMDEKILEEKIKQIVRQGAIPFFIGATLGTTVCGAFDNISPILTIKKKYNIWLHGDGAWGGASIMNDHLKKKLLKDVDQLDSFTIDFHKMLNSTLTCNFLLLQHQKLLRETCATGNTEYIFHDNEDAGLNSLQCGQKIDSLKCFLDWKFFGKQGLSDKIMQYHHLISYAEERILKMKNLELVVNRTPFNLCFHFIPLQDGLDINRLNFKIRQELQKRGLSLIAMAHVDGIFVFRLLITNPTTTKNNIDTLLENIVTIGQEEVEKFLLRLKEHN